MGKVFNYGTEIYAFRYTGYLVCLQFKCTWDTHRVSGYLLPIFRKTKLKDTVSLGLTSNESWS